MKDNLCISSIERLLCSHKVIRPVDLIVWRLNLLYDGSDFCDKMLDESTSSNASSVKDVNSIDDSLSGSLDTIGSSVLKLQNYILLTVR